MTRDDFLNGACAVASASLIDHGSQNIGASTAGIAVPDSALAKDATEIARAANGIEIFNHSLRTFLFAELFAELHNIAHDRELVYVASILHDTGLAPQHSSQNERFEVDGANLSRTLMQKHGAPAASADLVWDAIALHPQSDIAKWKAPEVKLVSTGVNMDFGAFLSTLPRDRVISILRSAPRNGFIEHFLSACEVIAAKKPESTGGSFMVDIGYRRVRGFHLSNFCDAVKTDPFASLE